MTLDGELLSLLASALNVLQRMRYKTAMASGSGYWVLDGELLGERRRRVEAGQLEEGGPSPA